MVKYTSKLTSYTDWIVDRIAFKCCTVIQNKQMCDKNNKYLCDIDILFILYAYT